MTSFAKRIGLMRRTSLLTILCLLAPAACTLGPAHRTPPAPVVVAWKDPGPWREAAPADQLGRGAWWELFGDPELDRLEDRARAASPTLQAALARYAQARAALGAAAAGRQPRLDLEAGAARQRSAGDFSAGGTGSVGNVFLLPVDLGYEIDLWGRVRRSVEAAGATADAALADYQSVLLFLQAEVARSYFSLRALDAEAVLLERAIVLREENLRLVRSRFSAGLIGQLDVTRAETELAGSQAEAVALARDRAALENALAFLCGEAAPLFRLPPRPLDLVPPPFAADLPATLLERRPDIAAAERRMAAANARIGVAQTAFFPALRLTGSAGYASVDLGDLFAWDNRTWGLGPSLSLPLFDGGRNRAELERAHAAWEETLADYRSTVLSALREAEDGLSGLRLLGEQGVHLERAVAAGRRAAELSRKRYRAGLVSYLEVVDADRTLLQAERQTIRLLGQRLEASVLLVKALGGGWLERTPAAPLQR